MSSARTRPQTSKLDKTVCANPRLPGLDPMRVVAAYAVIWIHTPQSEELRASVAFGRAAVPFFLGTSVLLLLRSLANQLSTRSPDDVHSNVRFAPFVRGRCQRLLLPFAAWSAIYLALKVVKKWLAPHQPNDFPGSEALIVGTAYHLWFLPYLFAVSLLCFLAGRAALHSGRTTLSATLAFGLGVACVATPCPYALYLPEAVTFMWLATPGVLWAYALAILYVQTPRTRFQAFEDWISVGAAILMIVATALLWHVGRDATLEAIAGIAMVVIAVATKPSRWFQRLGVLAPISFGIYLSHLLVLKISESVAHRLDWSVTPARDYALFTLAAFGSTSIAYGLSKLRRTRWLVS